jgi:hypothetical protein
MYDGSSIERQQKEIEEQMRKGEELKFLLKPIPYLRPLLESSYAFFAQCTY